MTAPGGQLIIEGRTITFSDLAESNSLTLADQPVLQFCKKWLDGQDYFEISTSGSTGSPKTIRLSRKQMEASALATQKALGLQAGMTALLCLDPRYIAGMMMLVRAMVTSMDLIVVPAVANPLEHIPNNTTIDFAAVVPYQLKEMVESPKKALLNSWRKVIVGGGA
jgi:O-succinylbenzoic acid--CoA ligase